MSDLRPLLSSDATEIERALLGSIASDAPRSASREAAMRAALRAAGPGSMAPPKPGGWAQWSSVKAAVFVGALVAALGLAAWLLPRAPTPAASAPASAPPQPAAPAAATTGPETTERAEPTESVSEEQPLDRSPDITRSSAKHPRTGTPRAKTSASPSIDAELALLRRARQAIASGDSGAALSALREHDAEFPNGPLRQEATLLRVRALVLAGDIRSARAVAEPFVEAHPSSHYAKELRQLVPGLNEASPPP